MTKVYGKIDSLKRIKEFLHRNGITRFKSVADVNEFNRNYNAEILRIKREIEKQVVSELEQLEAQRISLKQRYDDLKQEALKDIQQRNENFEIRIHNLQSKDKSNFVYLAFNRIQLTFLKYRQFKLEKGSEEMICRKTNQVAETLVATMANINNLTSNKKRIIGERSASKLKNMDRIRQVLEELNPLIAGAIGESKVQKELEKLPDNNVLFNDFSLRFNPPVYNRKEKQKIFSIQIDHLLVTNAGIFIIETKNWSRTSLKSQELRSPVNQIRRAAFALFVVLNNSENTKMGLKQHHWGRKQVPIRSIVVMINEKPKERFKFVKVKSLNELNSYIKYFEPIFDDSEVYRISDYLKEMKQNAESIHQKPGNWGSLIQVTRRGSASSSLHSWLKNNPGKEINDYYKDNRGQR